MINKEIARRRMRGQRIAWVKERSPYDVVRRLGAVQAQEYTQALWAIVLRMRNGSVEEIEKAVADRRVVLTWAMRGTLHFVPAEDMEWMIRLLAPRVLAKDTRRLEQLNIDPRQMALCEKTIGDALKERKRITRPNLMKLLEDAGFATQNQRGYHVLWYLAQTGLLCLGPMEGKQQTFVLAEDWIRERKALSNRHSTSGRIGNRGKTSGRGRPAVRRICAAALIPSANRGGQKGLKSACPSPPPGSARRQLLPPKSHQRQRPRAKAGPSAIQHRFGADAGDDFAHDGGRGQGDPFRCSPSG